MRPDNQEYHKVLYDWYTLEQDIHDWDVGQRRQAENTQLIRVVAKHVADRDLVHWSKCVHQQSFDTITRDVRVYVELLFKMVQIRKQHEELLGKVNKFRDRRDAAVLKVGSAETKHASVRFPRDTEYHCRMFTVAAADTLCK